MRVSIIGSGVVGNIIGEGLKQLGNEVLFYDIEPKALERIKNKGYDATNDIGYAIANSDISFVCVPTPTKEGKIDFTYIKSAAENIAKELKQRNGYHLVVIKSTVTPTTTQNMIIPILEELSRKKVGTDFGVCMNPEFLTEIANTWTDDSNFARGFFDEERIVIGEFDKKSGDLLQNLYEKLGKPIFRTDLKTAEFIKYAANCALASRISYWNEIASIGKKLNIDAQKVADIVALDKRIGKYGSVITDKGFQGKCLPKDIEAFISFAEQHTDPVLLKAVKKVNDDIQKRL